MTLRYPPTLQIGSYTIASAWDGVALLALADIRITWGRRVDIYEDVPPASLEVSILDLSGSWATDNQLQGETVIIGRTAPDRTMFRGRITDAKSTLIEIPDPNGSGTVFKVWLVTLSARDKLADLGQARPLGYPVIIADPAGDWPSTWWRHTYSQRRIDDVLGKGGSSIVATIDVPNLPTLLGVSAPAAADLAYIQNYLHPARPSLLRLIQDVYFGVPLGHVNYNAQTDGIELGTSASTGGMALILAAGIVKTSPVTGYSIPASKVLAPREPTIRSSVAAGVDIVQANYVHVLSTNVPNETAAEARTSRGSTTSRTLIIDTHFRDNYAGQGSYGDEYASALVTKTIALVDDLNDQFTPPPLQFDFRRFTTGTTLIDDLLLDTHDHPDPLYFTDSLLNSLPNFGPQFQLIGGTIRWYPKSSGSQLDAGWVVDMVLAPATGALDPVSMSSWLTNITPAASDIDPTLSMAELSSVTTGLA